MTQRLGTFFQLGYICRDLDRAIESFAARRGIAEFARMEGPMPHLGRSPHLRVALAYSGPIMIELIQPPVDVPTIYAHSIPPDSLSARLHHIAYRVDDRAEWDRIQEQLKRNGTPVAAGEALPSIDYCYVDTRQDTGHFTEYCWAHEETLAFWKSLPRNP